MMAYPRKHLFTLILAILLLLHAPAAPSSPSSSSSCSQRRPVCGNITLRYPFWILGQDASCGLPDYAILCNSSNTAFLVTDSGHFPIVYFNYPLMGASWNHFSIDASALRASVQACNGASSTLAFTLTNATAPFALSANNVFLVMGCRSYGKFSGSSSLFGGVSYSSSCQAGCSQDICSIAYPWSSLGYYSIGSSPCCFSWLPSGLTQIYLEAAAVGHSDECSVSRIFQPSVQTNNSHSLDIIWGIMFENTSQSCSTVSGTSTYACAQHSQCSKVDNFHAYICQCSDGYYGDGFKNGSGCSLFPTSTGGSTGNRIARFIIMLRMPTSIFVAILCVLLFCLLRSRETKRRKRRYFRLHGGHRLQELLPGIQGQVMPKLFAEGELEKATHKFSETMKLGSGGYGTVYKGILTDGSRSLTARSSLRKPINSSTKSFFAPISIIETLFTCSVAVSRHDFPFLSMSIYPMELCPTIYEASSLAT